MAAFISVWNGARPTWGNPGSVAPTTVTAGIFAAFRAFDMAGWYAASTWKSTKPLMPSFRSVFRLPTATGPLRLSTALSTWAQPMLFAALTNPSVRLTAKGWLPEKTS